MLRYIHSRGEFLQCTKKLSAKHTGCAACLNFAISIHPFSLIQVRVGGNWSLSQLPLGERQDRWSPVHWSVYQEAMFMKQQVSTAVSLGLSAITVVAMVTYSARNFRFRICSSKLWNHKLASFIIYSEWGVTSFPGFLLTVPHGSVPHITHQLDIVSIDNKKD